MAIGFEIKWGGGLGAVTPTPTLKVARIITSPGHRDSWVDAAGYIGLGAACAQPQP